jgi:hypothetical protein
VSRKAEVPSNPPSSVHDFNKVAAGKNRNVNLGSHLVHVPLHDLTKGKASQLRDDTSSAAMRDRSRPWRPMPGRPEPRHSTNRQTGISDMARSTQAGRGKK